jgi:Tol biopolymer transport system component
VGIPLPAETIISSTQWDGAPQYSPDGQRIAFASNRSGQIEIWVAEADGSNPVQLTSWNRYSGSPRWSPDGNEIAADSQEGDHTNIYVIGVKSRQTRKITSDAKQNFVPSWSPDGKWVYFVSDRRDGFQVWKAIADPAHDKQHAVQVTRNGGGPGWASLDGRRFYYAKIRTPNCVWTVAADGGEEVEAICPLTSWNYMAMFPDGMYYAPRTSTQIWFFSFADKQARHVFDLKAGAGGGFSISPDRKSLLITPAEVRGDLYLVDQLN